jgi:predicted secreted Zn-dependent protease
MKTTVAWGAKNTGLKFNLSAPDLQIACDVLCKQKEWGRFEGNLTYDSVGDSKGNCTAVTIKPSYNITMPAWKELSKQPKTCQDEWNRMWKALRGHEDGHLEVFQKGLDALVKQLTALKTGTHDDVDKIFKKALKSIQDGHNKYDSSTTHGQSEGVKLDIADECCGEAAEGEEEE